MSEFDEKVEVVASAIEGAAERAWKNRTFRTVSLSLSVAVEVGMMVSAVRLLDGGRKPVAACLFGLGAAGLACDLLLNARHGSHCR